MPILVDRSFSIITPESAEHGDTAESGLLSEAEPLTFRELVSELRQGEPSCWPASGSTREWVNVDQGETQAFYEHGEREERSVHYSRANPPRMARYWRLAMIAAGHARR